MGRDAASVAVDVGQPARHQLICLALHMSILTAHDATADTQRPLTTSAGSRPYLTICWRTHRSSAPPRSVSRPLKRAQDDEVPGTGADARPKIATIITANQYTGARYSSWRSWAVAVMRRDVGVGARRSPAAQSCTRNTARTRPTGRACAGPGSPWQSPLPRWRAGRG